MTAVLEVDDVRGGYGGADILNGTDLSLGEGEIVVIIGPNGAGKSTLMKAVFGLAAIRSGSVSFFGRTITGMRADQVAKLGMSYVPQERNVFASLTVNENLEMGAYLRDDDFGPQIERIYELFPPLNERRRQQAGTLSGGERQMLAMGRALMLDPKLLLLDEPTAALSPRYAAETFERIREINALGITILMVEQNARQALEHADRGVVLVMGENRFEAPGPELLANREVAEMYLGG